MRKNAAGFGMSFLDVLCSAMGAMVVLAVIFSIVKNPVLKPKIGEFILIEITGAANPDLGVLIRVPSGAEYAVRPDSPPDALESSAADVMCVAGSQNSGSEDSTTHLYLEVREPVVGTWIFRPYYADWTSDKVPFAQVTGSRVWTRDGPLAAQSASAPSQTGYILDATGHLESRGGLSVQIK